jgi:putative serine protease PepD
MTESNDPFAAKPYVPPADRDSSEPTPPATDDTAVDAPAPDAPLPAHAPEGTTPESAPTGAAPHLDQDATVPVLSESERAAAQTQPTPVVTPPAPGPAPAPEDFSHRYDDHRDADGYGPSAGSSTTQTLPPFAATETAYSHADGGSGGGVAAPPRRRRGRTLAGIVALAVLAGGAGFGGAWAYDQTQGDDGSPGVVSSLTDDSAATQTKAPAGTVSAVAEKVLPSVVQINVKGQTESGSGTGIIISSDGQILTNNHVVEVAADNGTITVAFSDGTNAKATIVGRDPKTDLAVVKATGKTGLSPAQLGTSADLKVGQEVVAIGSPFGLESTVTEGIISALNRPVSSSDGSGSKQSTTFPAVQTDAAINPGNSGGPLVDLNGRVIAINSAIRSGTTTSGDAGSIGLGFAIPIDLAKNVSKQLVDGKTVEHAQIGVSVDNFLSDDGITGVGAQVKEVVSGGAGDKAGIKKGDVITAVNGAIIPSSEALVASVRGFNPGEKITVTYTRDGKKAQTDVTLDSDGGKTS